MYIGVDLGTTNVKAALYDQDMKLVDRMSSPARYTREGGRVTFDAEEYYCILKDLLKKILSVHQITKVNEIAFTGQAETLVCLDKDDSLLLPAISWMDERSTMRSRMTGNFCKGLRIISFPLRSFKKVSHARAGMPFITMAQAPHIPCRQEQSQAILLVFFPVISVMSSL